MKKILFLNLFYLFLYSSVYAENSSTELDLPKVTPTSINGYILASGTNFYTYCNADMPGKYGPNKPNCVFTASTETCRPGYVPHFIVSETKNDFSLQCKLRGYIIEPFIFTNKLGGFDINFKNAYANFVGELGLCGDKPITLNWSIMCTR